MKPCAERTRSKLSGFAIVCLFLWFEAFLAYAEPPQARVVYTETPPVIDGTTDDACWKRAEVIDTFIQFEPNYGKSPADRTEVRLLYDRTCLYVAFDCYFPPGTPIAANMTQRDGPFFSDDNVGIFLDSFYDRRNCYAFFTNPFGTQRDMRIANEGVGQEQRMGGDASWDCYWEVKTSRHPDHWSAEMAIPFGELRFDRKGDLWGLNLWRNIEARETEITWADVGPQYRMVSRFGTLVGLDIPKLDNGQHLFMTPYFTANPYAKTGQSLEVRPNTGMDFRYPVASLTLDLTVNPDFAQIEADPSEVNLSDTERRLQEKRPFFLEGGELYRTPIEVFYTRRVEDLQMGAKLAGRIGSRNIAFVTAQSGQFEHLELTPEEQAATSNFSAFRFQQEFGSNVNVGLIGVNKWTPSLDRANGAGGADFSVRLSPETTVFGQVAGNWNRDGKMDTSVYDRALLVQAERRTTTLRTRAFYGDIGEHFDSEAGFIPRTNRRGFGGEAEYRLRFDSLLNRLGSQIRYERLTDSTGFLTNEEVGMEFNAGLGDFFLFLEPRRYYHQIDDELSPDFGRIFTDKTVNVFTGWFPANGGNVRIQQSYGLRDDRWSWFAGPSVLVRPTERFGVEASLQREVRRERGKDLWYLEWRSQRYQARYQFSQQSFATGSTEFTKDEKRFFILYGTEYRPKSFLYLVYMERHFKDTGKPAAERALFLKASYLTRMF